MILYIIVDMAFDEAITDNTPTSGISPYPAVALAVIENQFGELLVEQKSPAKISNGFAGLQYVFPGGKLDPGEMPVQAVVREVWEETGLALNGQVVFPVDHVLRHPVTQKEIYYFYWHWNLGRPFLIPELPHIVSLLWIPKVEVLTYMPTLNPKVRRILGI